MSENLDDLEARLRAQLDEVMRKKAEALEPQVAEITDVSFGAFPFLELKLSKTPSVELINRLRIIPGRNYIFARSVNQFPIGQYDRLVYELKEESIDPIISEANLKKIDEFKKAPDFRITFEEKKHLIKINKTIKQKSLPYIYNLQTWTGYSDYYTIAMNELMQWFNLQTTQFKEFSFELSEEVQKLLQDEIDKEEKVNLFADMKDAPEINFSFKWTDANGISHEFQLKPDQKVACKFDDTFGHRTLLSFDMGKGKTAIAIAQAERYNERVLFICKADLKTNIKREIYKFTGKPALVFSGIKPDGLAIDLMLQHKQQYNILNYDIVGREEKDPREPEKSLMLWVEVINLSKFDRIIYDEAHYMKNMEAQRSKGGRALKSSKVMLLTGTPIVNRPGELFPILNIIDPITFFDYPTFARQFTDFDGRAKNTGQLHKLLKKYMIRRLRDSSTDPNRIPVYTELSQLARKRYADVLDGLYIALRNPDYERNVTNVLVELLRLKQICADDKVDFTVGLIEEALDETVGLPWNKVLVFSQFKNTQSEIARRIGPRARVINGDVTDKARYDLVDKFQDPSSDLKVIVSNITEGLTLTQGGTIIINDLWWTPKDHIQAEGRAFGRENDPHGGNSYYVLAEDSIDSMIWELLEKKIGISKAIIDNVYEKVEAEESMFKELIRMMRG